MNKSPARATRKVASIPTSDLTRTRHRTSLSALIVEITGSRACPSLIWFGGRGCGVEVGHDSVRCLSRIRGRDMRRGVQRHGWAQVWKLFCSPVSFNARPRTGINTHTHTSVRAHTDTHTHVSTSIRVLAYLSSRHTRAYTCSPAPSNDWPPPCAHRLTKTRKYKRNKP